MTFEFLEISVQGSPPVRFPLMQRLTVLGRSPFNDLTFDSDDIARRQCDILRDEAGCRLIDRSGTGTSVNGEKLLEKVLKNGDEILLGDARLRYGAVAAADSERPAEHQVTAYRPLEKPPLKGRLLWRDGEHTRRFEIDSPVLIGADDSAHIVIEDEYVSRRHCQLVPGEDGMLLRDLQSTNGTWIGDIRVLEALLPAKCTFSVGGVDFDFEALPPAKTIEPPESFFGMIGHHPSILAVQRLMTRMAPLDETVLVTGETGTGKELAVRALHQLSGRTDEPFVVVNCGAISADLIESELFGHQKGAFTGAATKRSGAFLSAGTGTIFLDEIGELPQSLQPKLLRTLDSREIKPVGSDRSRQHSARVITATNRDLAALVSDGAFRADLYYRLSALPIRLPPLRERREDIPLLVDYLLAESKVSVRLSGAACDALMYYFWPGNVRELKNVLTSTLCYHPEIHQTGVLNEEQLMLEGPGALLRQKAIAPAAPKSYHGQTLQETEVELIQEALSHYGGNKRLVSKALGISKSTLYDKLKRYSGDA